MLPLTLPALISGLVQVHGADPVLGHQGGVLYLSDQSPFATFAALDIGPRVHDALKLILLQLPDLLDGAGLLLNVLFVRNVLLEQVCTLIKVNSLPFLV